MLQLETFVTGFQAICDGEDTKDSQRLVGGFLYLGEVAVRLWWGPLAGLCHFEGICLLLSLSNLTCAGDGCVPIEFAHMCPEYQAGTAEAIPSALLQLYIVMLTASSAIPRAAHHILHESVVSVK